MRRNSDGVTDFLVMIILGIITMPFIGVYLLSTSKGDGFKTGLGAVLLIVGLVIMIAM